MCRVPSGRFAPSPTGRLHLGNLRTALVAWLYARHDGARFLLRFEDLDTAAVRAEHYQSQLDDLAALGLDWDEPIVRQSDRLDAYQETLNRLIGDDLVYPCYCSRREIREAASAPNIAFAGHRYPGTCASLSTAERSKREATRPPAYRLRADGHTYSFVDDIAGPQTFALDDFVVCRNDGTPAYHLVVVTDDAAAGIEMVVRADDLLESTARHLHLYALLDHPAPRYAHVPLVLSPEGDRLAKRHGAVTLADRAAKGESPGDVLRYLAGSLGLVGADADATADGDPVTANALVDSFDPARLPREPLILAGGLLAPTPPEVNAPD